MYDWVNMTSIRKWIARKWAIGRSALLQYRMWVLIKFLFIPNITYVSALTILRLFVYNELFDSMVRKNYVYKSYEKYRKEVKHTKYKIGRIDYSKYYAVLCFMQFTLDQFVCLSRNSRKTGK